VRVSLHPAVSVQPLSCFIVHRVRSTPFSEFQTHVTASLAAFFAPSFSLFFFFLFFSFGGGVLFDLIFEPCLYTDKAGFLFYLGGFFFFNFVM
jgi:hypothetical protein